MKRIILTGAQGTGKTTVLNQFDCNELTRIVEVARDLNKVGVKINEQGNAAGQRIIFDTYYEKLSQKIDYISDRGLTDVISYTKYLYDHCTPGTPEEAALKDELLREVKLLDKFVEDNKDIKVFLFPIEFALKDDGVRSTNEEFRKNVDRNIRKFVNYAYADNFKTVGGTVRERVNFIKSNL